MEPDNSNKTPMGNTVTKQCAPDNHLYQTIVESIPSAVFVFQGDKMCYVNTAAQSQSGYSEDELLAMPFWKIVHADFQDIVRQRGRLRQDGHDISENYDVKITRKNGETRWINFRASIIEFNGRPAVLGVAEDITESKKSRSSLQLLQKIVDQAEDCIYASDLDGRFILLNRASEKVLTKSKNQLIGQPFAPYIAPEHLDLANEMMQKKLQGKVDFTSYELDIIDAKGGRHQMENNSSVVTDDAGKPIAIQGILRNIEARKESIQQLMQYKQQQDACNELSIHAIAETNIGILLQQTTKLLAETLNMTHSKVLELRPGSKKLLLRAGIGWKQGLVGFAKVSTDLKHQAGYTLKSRCAIIVEDFHRETRFQAPELLREHEIISGLSVIIGDPYKPWGILACHSNTIRQFNKDDVTFIQTLANTLTLFIERQESEMLLRKLSQAIGQAGESIMIANRSGIIEYVNPAFTKLTGYSAEDAIGKTPRILKSGNQDRAFYEAMWKSITSGHIWQNKVIEKRKDGSFVPVILTIAPITDHTGTITHFVASHADISKLEDMEKQFHQAQKMEAVGTLVSGIAHDFNNMLAGMTGNLYLAKRSLQDRPDTLQKLENIEALSFRAADMVKQLLTFARKDIVAMNPLPFTVFIKETFKFLYSSIPESIKINQEICSEPLHIIGDATQLHQVLMNLLNNARDAVENTANPSITVKLEVFQADETFISTHPYFKVGSYAHLSVEDNGYGIAKHQIIHVFEPFFTTKEPGKGTGLGLAMVFGGIKRHKGFIEVESSKGEGSTFHVYIPLSEEKGEASTTSQKQEDNYGHGELILLADDEQHVRETTAEVLEALGYKVLLAKDGVEALALFKAHKNEITVALLDLIMPLCGGVLLAKRIRKINADIPIIFITGYDKEHMFATGEQIHNSDMLSKPVQFDALSHLIKTKLKS